MWTVKVVGLGLVVVSLSVELLGWFLRHRRTKKPLIEVLFFPSELACLEHIFTSSLPFSCYCPLPHGVETSFSRLLRHILSASSSLDVCVFAFSNTDLSRAVVALHKKGVTIRVLTDNDYSAIQGSQVGILRKAGICVRCDADSGYMHHKFAVVDGQLLITGSLNWTITAVQGNMENVIITQDPDLVRPFNKEFHRLWLINDPDRKRSNEQKPARVPAGAHDLSVMTNTELEACEIRLGHVKSV